MSIISVNIKLANFNQVGELADYQPILNGDNVCVHLISSRFTSHREVSFFVPVVILPMRLQDQPASAHTCQKLSHIQQNDTPHSCSNSFHLQKSCCSAENLFGYWKLVILLEIYWVTGNLLFYWKLTILAVLGLLVVYLVLIEKLLQYLTLTRLLKTYWVSKQLLFYSKVSRKLSTLNFEK